MRPPRNIAGGRASRAGADLIGPFRPGAYLGAYVFLVLPTAFIVTALLFSLSALGQKAIAAYFGSALLFFHSNFSWQFFAGTLGWWKLARFLDPFCLTVFSELSKVWTPAEKNTLLVGLQGPLLANRALWLGIALSALALTHRRFRFAHPSPGSWRNRGSRRQIAERAIAPGTTLSVPRAQRSFGSATHALQTFAIAWQSFRTVVSSWGWFVLAFLPFMVVLSGPELMEHMGIRLFPTTARMTAWLTDPQDGFWLLIPMLIVFFAGELVWREREARLSEIADAAPAPDWVPFVGKLIGLGQARHEFSGSERIAFEAVVGTDEDQVAVAPGRLHRTWTESGRRYFHYVTDAPICDDYAFFSAAYAVHEGRWNDVSIQIYHHPDHAWNLDSMIRSVQASLSYYAEQFGPYPQGQIRIVEQPGNGIGLHAFPINISYQEGFSLFNPEDGPQALDFPFAVVGHEVAHQWWGNQVTPAYVEGAALLSESLAWYSAMGVVEKTYGPDHLRRLLRLMREAYLTPHARANVPLLRATDWLQAYRKGPFAMYALREYIGEERVNAALRRLLRKHGAGEPPLPTSLDLYRELQAVTPASLRYLLADLFEANTYWELSTERVTARQAEPGSWQVTLDVEARKVVVDRVGIVTEVPMDDLVEVGVFVAAEDGGLGDPLYLRMHRVRSGKQKITVTVQGKPAGAGIDPRSLLIDVDATDNLERIGG